jgi:hypothetical protein
MNSLVWIVPVAAMAASGCVVVSSHEKVTKTYDVAGFDSVSATQGVNVVVRQGAFAISAEGPEERVERLTVEREGSTLKLGQKSHVNWFSMGWSDRTVITVTAPGYASIEANGGSDVDIEGLRQETLRVSAGGGADVNLHAPAIAALEVKASGGADINASNISSTTVLADASGGADINISGSCSSVTAETSGGADFNGGDLRCESAIVSASGGGDAEVTATASASGRASSGGDVRFRGNPVSFQEEESGGGDVSAGR